MYCYIDESGDNGHSKRSSKYFILAAVCVENEDYLTRIAKKIHKKTIRERKDGGILHAHNNSELVNKAILKELLKFDFKVYYVSNKNYRMALEILIRKLSAIGVRKVYLARKEQGKNSRQYINMISEFNNLDIVITTPQQKKVYK